MHHVIHSPNSYDVVVVGGRVAGSATAMLLARHGMRVLVVERSARGEDALSTHALMRGAVLQLKRWGLLDAIVDAGTPAVRRTRFTYGDERLDITIRPSHGVDALYAPRRTVLDPVLADAALAAGVEFRYRSAVTALLHHRGRVTGVRLRDAAGHAQDVVADLVIGADGIRSTVAAHVRAEAVRRARHASAVTYGYWADLDTVGYEWVFRANACSGAVPTNDGLTCVFGAGRPDRIGRGGVDVIGAIVAEGDADLAARLAQARPPSGTRAFTGQAGYMRRAHGPGWALVGDAGYFKDPISAHGLTDALRDAELLARAVTEGYGRDTALAESLHEYEVLRDRLSTDLFETVDRIAGNDWDDAQIAELLKHLSSATTAEVDALASLDLVGAP